MKNKANTVIVTLISLSSISLMSKAFGFIREIVLSHYFGTSAVADAYIMAGNIIGVLFGWVSTIYICYTPIFSRVVTAQGKKKGLDFTRTLITVFELIAVVCVLLTIVFSDSLVRLVAPGFSGESLKLAGSFLKCAILILLVQPFIYPLKAYLEYEGRFLSAGFPDISVSVFQIIIIAAGGLLSYKILPYAMSVPYIIQGLFLLISAQKSGFTYIPQCTCINELKSLFRLIVPYFLSSLLIEINSFVDRYFASSMQQGSIAILNYAGILNTFVLNVFIMAVSVMIYPNLTKAFVNGNHEKYKRLLGHGLDFIIVFFTPLLFGVLSLSEVVVFCVYGHGAFNAESVVSTARIFAVFALSLPALAVRELLFKALYAGQNTKLPLISGVVTTILNIFLNVILAPRLGTIGLALATAFSVIITVPFLGLTMSKKMHCFSLRHLASVMIKAILSSIAMLVVITLCKQFINIYSDPLLIVWLKLIGCAVISALVYFVIIFLFGIKPKIER